MHSRHERIFSCRVPAWVHGETFCSACMHACMCEGPAGGVPSPQILLVIVNNSIVVSLRACVVQSIKQSTNILITCLFICILYVIISNIWSHHFLTEFLFSPLLLSHYFFHLHTSMVWQLLHFTCFTLKPLNDYKHRYAV